MSDLESLRKKIAEEEARLARVEKERDEALARLERLKEQLIVEGRSNFMDRRQSGPTNSPTSNRHRQPRTGGAYPPGDSFSSGRLTLSESIRAASEIPFEVDLVEKSHHPRKVKYPQGE